MPLSKSESDSLVILLADDDEDDCMLVEEALLEAQISNPLNVVHDGKELLDYLYRRGPYADPETSPRPALILLDLNMPLMDGRKALWEIKKDPNLKNLPVVILTTSNSPADVDVVYASGASGFVTKPVRFEELVKVLKGLEKYWFGLVQLPAKD